VVRSVHLSAPLKKVVVQQIEERTESPAFLPPPPISFGPALEGSPQGIELALFPGYVFVPNRPEGSFAGTAVASVVRFVSCNGIPAAA